MTDYYFGDSWTLGIVDAPPRTWSKLEQLWQDEKLVASSSHSFLDVMNELCNTAIKNRREYDHGVDEHLWKMKISSLENVMNPRDPYDDNDDDSKEEGGGLLSSKTILIVCPQDEAHSGLGGIMTTVMVHARNECHRRTK